MRQRNDTGHPLTVHTDPPRRVEPDEVIDYDTPVIGLTVLDDDAEEAQPAEAATDPTTKPARAGRSTAAKEATA